MLIYLLDPTSKRAGSEVPCPQKIHTNQSVENAGVAFVTGADERNESFERINKQ